MHSVQLRNTPMSVATVGRSLGARAANWAMKKIKYFKNNICVPQIFYHMTRILIEGYWVAALRRSRSIMHISLGHPYTGVVDSPNKHAHHCSLVRGCGIYLPFTLHSNADTFVWLISCWLTDRYSLLKWTAVNVGFMTWIARAFDWNMRFAVVEEFFCILST